MKFGTPTIITSRHLIYAGVIGASVIGAALLFLPSPYNLAPFGLLVAGFFVVMTFKYPMFGVYFYMLVYFFKPQELFPSPIPYERIIALLVLAAMVIHIAVNEKKFDIYQMDKAFLAFLAACFLSIPLAGHITLGWEVFFEFFKVFLVYLFMTRIANTPRRFKAIVWLYMLSLAFVAGTAFYNYYSGNFSVRMGIQRAHGMEHGAYTDPNSVANSLVLGIPFLYYMISHYRRTVVRASLAAIFVLCLWTIIITGSRGGMLGALVLAVVLAFNSRHKALASVGAVVALLVVAIIMPQQYKDRFLSITDFTSDSSAAVSAYGRIEGLLLGIQFFTEMPITGAGIGNFPWKNLYHGSGKWLDAHNLPGKLIGELGLLGILTFSFFIYALIRGIRQVRFKYREKDWPDDFYSTVVQAVKVSLIMLFFQGLFGHNLYRFNWYIFAGFVLIVLNIIRQRSESETAQMKEIASTTGQFVPKR